MLNYWPNGRKRLGRSLKKLSDEAKTGLSRPNWWRMMSYFTLKIKAQRYRNVASYLPLDMVLNTQKTWIFSNTAERTLNLAFKCLFRYIREDSFTRHEAGLPPYCMAAARQTYGRRRRIGEEYSSWNFKLACYDLKPLKHGLSNPWSRRNVGS
jgi:hypothetical protein